MRPRGLVWTAIVFAVLLLPVPAPDGHGAVTAPQDAAASIHGLWTLPTPSHIEAIHMALLPTGKVLYYENHVGVRLYDPVTGALTAKPLPFGNNLFCSGHIQLADGRLLVLGGTLPSGYGFAGERTSFLFDPWTETWSQGPSMTAGRWYPTPVLLPDGSVLAFSGLDTNGATTPLVERFDGTRWSVVQGADRLQSLYPRLFVVPGGDVLRVGHEAGTAFFDPETATWRDGPSMGTDRWQGSAVLLPGLEEVLAVGGSAGGNTLASSVRVDVATGIATPTGGLHVPRRDLNLVLLPDRTVLAVGGASGPTMPNPGVLHTIANAHPTARQAVGTLDATMFRYPSAYHAERYDPESGTWSLMAAAQRARTYHATALLLPDGSVLVSGSDIETVPTTPPVYETSRTLERFLPPYLFQGPRPTIDAAPERLTYGGSATILSTESEYVGAVVLMRLGSVTHAFNFAQRLVDLPFVADGDTLYVTGPPTPDRAAPGWYLLFVVDHDGVPSEGRMVHLSG